MGNITVDMLYNILVLRGGGISGAPHGSAPMGPLWAPVRVVPLYKGTNKGIIYISMKTLALFSDSKLPIPAATAWYLDIASLKQLVSETGKLFGARH